MDQKIFENENIIVEIGGNVNEEYAYTYYSRQKKIEITEEYREKLKIIEEKIKDYLSTLNPVDSQSINSHKEIVNIKFKIKPTEHWYTKFFRKEFEDPHGIRGYVNPDLFEGINLVVNNIDFLCRMIVNGTVGNNEKMVLKTKDDSKYAIVITMERKSKHNYSIILISQLKGLDVFYTKDKLWNVNTKKETPLEVSS